MTQTHDALEDQELYVDELVEAVPQPVVLLDDEPQRPVFSGAAQYKALTVSIILAVGLVIAYGLYALGALLFASTAPPARAIEVLAVPARAIPASAPLAVDSSDCATGTVSAFVDHDANGTRTANEEGLSAIDVQLRGQGVAATGVTDASGQLAAEVGSLGGLLATTTAVPDGMWPGPRPPASAGGEPLLTGSCEVELGFVPLRIGARLPVATFGGLLPAARPTREGPSPLGPGITGVQVHGRVFQDLDGDDTFGLADQGVAGVTIRLDDATGRSLASVTTTASGLYSFANLEAETEYEIRLDSTVSVESARAIGEPASEPGASVTIRTGDFGLTVWGVDFELALD